MRIEHLHGIRFFPFVFLIAVWIDVAGIRPIETEPPPLVEEEWPDWSEARWRTAAVAMPLSASLSVSLPCDS